MILPYRGQMPRLDPTVFVAPSADVIGPVEIGPESSVWFQVVIRCDVNSIKIGARTNIQDHSMIHVTRNKASTTIGDDVTVGHHVMLHGCTVGDRCLIGMGAVLLDLCEIGSDSVVAAGAVVTQGKKFPPRSLILGSPAKVARELTDEEVAFLKKSAENYVRDSREYMTALSSQIQNSQSSNSKPGGS